MPAIIISSLQPGEGRTTVAAGLGTLLAGKGRKVTLLRVRSGSEPDAPAEDDARSLAAVPGCSGARGAVSEQEAQAQARDAGDAVVLLEAPAGVPSELAQKLSAQVVLVTAQLDGLRLGDLAAARDALGGALTGVIATRVPERGLAQVEARLGERGLASLGALPEDRLLAGPSPNELAEALHASRLVEGEQEDEAVEAVMIGPVSADPGQPYFLQHGSKAVVNRFDKMDLHLAALATEPDCLILTGGQQPSPYLLDRASANDWGLTVLLAPEGTVRTIEAVDELYGRTRFAGKRKLERAVELAREHLYAGRLLEALG
jgi:BioD-like phosphotransacetylase family protein